FPTPWDHAAIKTPDFSLVYSRKDTHTTCDITLTRPAALDIELPVNTTAVTAVTNNGQPVKYQLAPAFHRTLVKTPLPTVHTAHHHQRPLINLHAETAPPAPAVTIAKDAHFTPIDLSKQFNADIRQIYKQQYLSPRPNTCSLRLATDGYATWQMVLQKNYKTPDIDLTNVPTLLDQSDLLTPTLHVPSL